MDIYTLLDEIRAIARTGLHYSEDPFDRDRYERLLDLASREYAEPFGIDPAVVHAQFLADLGHTTTKVGADAGVFDDDGRIFLVRRTDDRKWGMVAGWVEPGEHPSDTVVRELAEEVGVDAVVDQLVGVFSRTASPMDPQGIVAVVYLCSLRTFDFRVQPHEVVEWGWHDIDDVTEWHKTHEAYARAAYELWLRRRAG